MNALTSRPKEPYLVIGPRRSGRTTKATEIAEQTCSDLKHIVCIRHGISESLYRDVIRKQVNSNTEVILIDQIDDLSTQIHFILKLAEEGIKPRRCKRTIYPTIIAVVLTDPDRVFENYLPFVVKRCYHHSVINTVTTEPQKIQLEFSPEEAKSLSLNLSEMLCWWQGFQAGIRTIDEFSNIIGVAKNGVEAARKLNEKIKSKLEPF